MYQLKACFVGPRIGKTPTFNYFRMMSLPNKKQRDAFKARKEFESDKPEFVDLTFNLMKENKDDKDEPI